MQRKSFLKSIIGLIVAPSILANIDYEVKEIPTATGNCIDSFTITGLPQSLFRLGDIVSSDMGDKAMVTTVAFNSVTFRPCIYGKYNFKDQMNILRFASTFPA